MIKAYYADSIMHRLTGKFTVKHIPTLVILVCISMLSHAGSCDQAWNGDDLTNSLKGQAFGHMVRLQDQASNTYGTISVGQIRAFYETKERISAVVGLTPAFIICGGKEPNAFATTINGTDTVGVTIGMLNLVNGDPDVAAEVIGHEYAHHTQGHLVYGQAKEMALTILGEILGNALERRVQKKPNLRGIGLDLGRIGATLASRKFSRDQEREADAVGFGYLVRARYNPNGALYLSRLMLRNHGAGVESYFDSHPGWEERADRFKALIAGNPEAQQLALMVSSNPSVPIGPHGSPSAFSSSVAMTASQRNFALGVERMQSNDLPSAFSYFKAAAGEGYAPAQTSLAYFYRHGVGGVSKDKVEEARLNRLAADQGDAVGQANLGAMYLEGLGGVPQNPLEGLRLTKLSADRGNPTGQLNFGISYAFGQGHPKDDVEAVQWYRRAADQGLAPAQFHLACMYRDGRGGLPKSEADELKWLKLSAAGVYPDAISNLGLMHAQGRGGLQKNEAMAVRLYQEAITLGSKGGQANLGQCYLAGKCGLPRDDREAARLFILAADQGEATSNGNLAGMYFEGRGGLQRDTKEAERRIRLCAEQGLAFCQSNLAYSIETGMFGLAKNSEAATEWYKKAAAQGNQPAIDALRRLGRL